MSEPSTVRKLPMRWRKARRSWRRAFAAAHELWRGEDYLAMVQQNKDGTWFWHGGGHNAVHSPGVTLEEAKTQAAAHIRGMDL